MDDFLTKKVVAISWNQVGDSIQFKNLENLKAKGQAAYPDYKTGQVNNVAGQFILIKKGKNFNVYKSQPKIMQKLLISAIFLFLTICLSCNSPKTSHPEEQTATALKTPGDISAFDKMFLELAGSAGIMEVELGKLAEQKATRPEITKYGTMMVAEHTQINEDFKKLLQKLNLTVPDTMNAQNAQTVKEHAALTGKAFDEKYVKTMITDHESATNMFKTALDSAKNEEYKQFLKPMITIVQHHYKMALELQNKMK